MNKKEIREKAFSCADSISIESIVERYYMGNKNRKGSTVFINCPNPTCPSSHKRVPDHCAITYSKNCFHCFSCDAKGGPIGLYSLLSGKDIITSALDLSLSVGGITDSEYRMVINDHNNGNCLRFQKREREKEFRPAPDAIRNLIYKELVSMDAFSLTDEIRDYLKNNRNITENLSEDFFCYHKEFSVTELINRLKANYKNFEPKVLAGVPGFYFKQCPDNPKKGWWRFVQPPKNPTLGLLIKNSSNEIVGLQMRDIRPGCKYYWISSNNINNSNEGYMYGTTPGSPVSVEYPEHIKNSTVIITEGKFKALEFVKRTGSITLSVQGVSNCSKIPDVIKKVVQVKRDVFEHQELNIYIGFDADLITNRNVFNNLKKLSVSLNTDFPYIHVNILVWKKEYGKGFDDLTHTPNYQSFLKLIRDYKFVALYESSLEFLLKKYNKPIEVIEKNKNEKELFYGELYNLIWEKIEKHLY